MTRRRIAIALIILVLLIPSVPFVHGLYVGTLPTNTIYADDFESYTTTTCTATSSGQVLSSCLGGWNFIDNGAGGVRGINNTNFYSCCHSLYLQDSNAAGGKFDVDRRFGLVNNSTRIITASFWFAVTKALTTANNQNSGNIHFAIEAWNKVSHFECLTFMYGDTIGVHPDFITAPSVDNNNPNSHFETWDDSANGGDISGYWHHVTVSCDILNMKWGTIVIDGFDYSSQVTGQTMRTLADTGLGNFNPPQGFRFEFATQNGGTHVGADEFNAWLDDLIVTDTTTIPTQAFFAANELWKAVAAMGSMMSVVTMYSSVRAYQELDPLRRRMKLMVAVVFAVGAGTLAVFAIILSRL